MNTPTLADLAEALTEGRITFRHGERYGFTRRQLADAMSAYITNNSDGIDWTMRVVGHTYVG